MKRTLALILTLITITLTGCASVPELPESASDGFPYTFTDSTGADVTLSSKPQTVAVLFSSFADIWTTAGGTVGVTVGESVARGFADADAVLVDSGTGHSSIDLEALIAAKPDLVIGTADYGVQSDAVSFCRDAGIPSALFRVESFGDYLGVLKIFCDLTGGTLTGETLTGETLAGGTLAGGTLAGGTLTGETDSYRKYGTEVGERIDKILDAVRSAAGTDVNMAVGTDAGIDVGTADGTSAGTAANGGSAERILFVRAGSSAKSTKAKTSDDNFACVMLKELGTVNIADSAGTELSLEAIVTGNPDFLFITTMGDETAAKDYMDSLLASEGWRELDCVKSGKYAYLPKELFHYKPNSRWDEAYLYLARLLYPEL